MRDRIQTLLIERDATRAAALAEGLASLGFVVRTAATAAEGIGAYSPGLSDVVLVGRELPDMSGLEVLAELGRLDRDVVALMITARGGVRCSMKAAEGADEVSLPGPLATRELALAVRRCIACHRLRRGAAQLCLHDWRWIGAALRQVALAAEYAVAPGPALPTPGETADLLSRLLEVPYAKARAEFERLYMTRAFERGSHRIAPAARLAEMDASNFRRSLKKHGLYRPRGKGRIG